MNNSPVYVYRLNPDGSKGELIKTMPAYPKGWEGMGITTNHLAPDQNRATQKRRGRQAAPYDIFKQLYETGKTDLEIAHETGCVRATVRKWRAKSNLPNNHPEDLCSDYLLKKGKFCMNCAYLQTVDINNRPLPTPMCAGEKKYHPETTPGCYAWAKRS